MAAFRVNQEMVNGSVQSELGNGTWKRLEWNQEMENGSVQSELGNGKWKRLERKQEMENGSVQSENREWNPASNTES